MTVWLKLSEKDLQLSAVVCSDCVLPRGKGLGGTLSFSRGSGACALEDKSVAWNKEQKGGCVKEDALHTSHEF